jgi:type I restriction enzyme S subunit
VGNHATDPTYLALLRDDFEILVRTREYVEALWDTYKPYSDPDFVAAIGSDFDSRFWEMYLTCTLLEHGHDPQSFYPGPDNLIVVGDTKVWIEAVAPTQGMPAHPDRVPDMKTGGGKAVAVPDDKIILRFAAAIAEKASVKHPEYMEHGVVSATDCYVVAVNGCKIDLSKIDPHPPRIVRTVFPIGNVQLHFDRDTAQPVGYSFEFRGSIEKAGGAGVPTTIFVDENYRHLSAVMFSNVDAANPTSRMGEDFILVHNPHAAHPIPKGLFKFGEEYFPEDVGDSIKLTRIDWEH